MNTPRQQPTSFAHQAGFTLVEAMVALIVTAFGMLAIAGFQMTLSRGADLAKQRSEAVRLAQEKIEELRAFAYVDSTSGAMDYTSDVVSSTTPEVIAAGSTQHGVTYRSNTNFRRSWTVTKDGSAAAVGTDLQKWIEVRVEWADRVATSGTDYNQSVTLRSVISRSDPINMKMWTTNAASTTNRTPKNRNIDIPYPAIDFGNGTSGFRPGPTGSTTNPYFIFNNVTGEVTNRCTGSSVVAASSGTCTSVTAYLLSGYIYYTTSNISASELTLTVSSGNNNIKTVFGLASTDPVTLQFTSSTASAAKECFVEDQMVRSSDNAIVPYDPSASSGSKNYAFTTYVCVITPVVITTGEKPEWFGQFLVSPGGSWTLGTGSSSFKVCRFSGDYDYDNKLSNSEHPLIYRGVTGSLDNQNYVVIPGNRTCPSDTEAALLTGKYTNNNTFTQQTELPSGSATHHGGVLSIQSNQWVDSTAESSDTTVELEML